MLLPHISCSLAQLLAHEVNTLRYHVLTPSRWNTWQSRWEHALAACQRLGGDVHPLEIGPPATEPEVLAVERELGYRLPTSFRSVLTSFARRVSFAWFLPSHLQLPTAFHDIFSGQCAWDLEQLLVYEYDRRGWVNQVFPNPDDPYDRVWHHTFAFMPVPNGDYLTIDLQAGEDGPVVYASHDDGGGHGYKLGANFIDCIDRWTQLGCPGGEDWQILPFLESPTSYINPTSENGREWQAFFGIATHKA